MCGIVGIRRFDGEPVVEGVVRAMAAVLSHRGPDDEGYWVDGSVGFGHRRLSIIDVQRSSQPMASVDGRCHLTFNGEIFNYRELRATSKYAFQTGGDTEVILANYLHDGPNGVSRLEGQFAFGLFDRNEQSLWLARDRLGVLPLYYYHDERLFAFASEIKALLPAIPGPQVDHDSLTEFLARRAVPAPHTLFRNVHKLQPGHQLCVSSTGSLGLTRYWSIPAEVHDPSLSPQEAVTRVAIALEQSVRSSLIADVPVGAYLSGGVDSSLIVAMVARVREGEGLETFSAGFGDPRFDELPVARQVATRFGTNHHEVMVGPGDFEELWPKLTWHRDAPISEPADVAVFHLARRARETVKVVLSGEGSDELFGGYPKYRYARWTQTAGVIPAAIRGPALGALANALPHGAARARIALRALTGPTFDDRLLGWFSPFTEAERRKLLGLPIGGRGYVSPAAEGDPVRRMLISDCGSWLADNLLERGDRMSMAASLELRPPFLDRKLVELAFSLPSNVKVRRGGETKWIVKEVARRYLPSDIVNRRKVGFRVPLELWFRGGLREMAHDLLGERGSFVSEVMDRQAVQGLLERHDRGRQNEDIRLWTLLGLEVWHRVFFRSGSTNQTGLN